MSFLAEGTLVASTVTTVTLDAAYEQVMIINRDGSAEIYVTLDGTTPTVGGAGTYLIPAEIGEWVFDLLPQEQEPGGSLVDPVIKLVSASTPKYGVQAPPE